MSERANTAGAGSPPFVVIGSTGFIGAALCRALTAEGRPFAGFSSASCELRDADQVRTVLAPHLRDAIVVYAAGRHRHRGDSVALMCDNVRAVANLAEACEASTPRHLIFLSSVEVYGAPRQLPITEATPLECETNYAIGKLAAEKMCERWQRHTGAALTLLRLPGIYGPGDTSNGLICRLVEAAARRTPFTLTADGSELRDYVFIGDLLRCILALAGRESGRLLLNVASGSVHSLSDIVAMVAQLSGTLDVRRSRPAVPGASLVFDVARLRARLPADFQFTSMAVSLRATLAPMREDPYDH